MNSSKPRRPRARRLGAAALGGAAIIALAAGPAFAHASTTGSGVSAGDVRMILLHAELFDADADEAAQLALLEDEVDGAPAGIDQASPDVSETPAAAETPDVSETPDATDQSGEDQSGGQDQSDHDQAGDQGGSGDQGDGG